MNKWSIKELKQTAKSMLKFSYWKCVIVGLLISILLGGFGLGFSGNGFSGLTYKIGDNDIPEYTFSVDSDTISSDEVEVAFESLESELSAASPFIWVVFVIAYLVGIAVVILFSTFLLNPFSLGVSKFFQQMHYAPADLNHLDAGFTKNYKSNVKTLFMRDLFIFLWSLLFIIPGIIKTYSYRMVPYLIAENPEFSYKEALEKSAQMMKGHKFHAFGLDMSFFGWMILSTITFNILGIFYTIPYYYATDAELYHALKPQAQIPEMN